MLDGLHVFLCVFGLNWVISANRRTASLELNDPAFWGITVGGAIGYMLFLYNLPAVLELVK